jgi:hypothetical protein
LAGVAAGPTRAADAAVTGMARGPHDRTCPALPGVTAGAPGTTSSPGAAGYARAGAVVEAANPGAAAPADPAVTALAASALDPPRCVRATLTALAPGAALSALTARAV